MAMMQRRLQADGVGGDMLEALMLAADGLDKAAAVTQALADALDTAGDALVKAGWNQFKVRWAWRVTDGKQASANLPPQLAPPCCCGCRRSFPGSSTSLS